jgi:hypothetical protein
MLDLSLSKTERISKTLTQSRPRPRTSGQAREPSWKCDLTVLFFAPLREILFLFEVFMRQHLGGAIDAGTMRLVNI